MGHGVPWQIERCLKLYGEWDAYQEGRITDRLAEDMTRCRLAQEEAKASSPNIRGGRTTTQMLCTDHDVLLSVLRGFEPVVSQSYHGTLTDATAAISVSTRPCVTSYSTKASWFSRKTSALLTPFTVDHQLPSIPRRRPGALLDGSLEACVRSNPLPCSSHRLTGTRQFGKAG
jgi:hypothetical protein